MGYLLKADQTGHSNVINWGRDRLTQKEAEKKFNELIRDGHSMFALGEKARKLDHFEPETNTIAIRGLQGG